MKPFTIRMHARPFSRAADGTLQTVLKDKGAPETVSVDSFEKATENVNTFGAERAPCVVWVSIVNSPKPRGFDAWADAAAKITHGEAPAPPC